MFQGIFKRSASLIFGVLLVVSGMLLLASEPRPLPHSILRPYVPHLGNGQYMFNIAGCASCHAAPAGEKCDDPKSNDRLKLAGGRCFKTPYGTFYAPNISPDMDDGIGSWTELDFVNAMVRGVSPDRSHYYPAFPYTYYQRMKLSDLLDIKAYINSLVPVKSHIRDHDLPLLLRLRRSLGLWKWLFLDEKRFKRNPEAGQDINRGAYLVEGPGHCGACHTPRNWLGGAQVTAKLSGGPALEGKGHVPNITPHATGIGSWSRPEIAFALKTGFTPDFDTLGGTMAAVQRNLARLTDADRLAIAAYLKSIPPVETMKP